MIRQRIKAASPRSPTVMVRSRLQLQAQERTSCKFNYIRKNYLGTSILGCSVKVDKLSFVVFREPIFIRLGVGG